MINSKEQKNSLLHWWFYIHLYTCYHLFFKHSSTIKNL